MFIFLILFIWTFLQFLAPILLPNNTVGDLSGLTLIQDNENTIQKLNSPWNFIYSVGDRLCHQKVERSLILNDNQMPFCSRCTAIWIGMVIGLGLSLYFQIKLDGKFVFIIIFSFLPLAIDGVGQLVGLWESNNLIRVATGLLTGLATGISIAVIVDETFEILSSKNQKLVK
jgi:uncharacterized membrane protein